MDTLQKRNGIVHMRSRVRWGNHCKRQSTAQKTWSLRTYVRRGED